MRNKKIFLFCIFFIFWIFCVNLINTMDYHISDAGVRYDPGIESMFNYQNRVYVTITIKDNSGIVYNVTKEDIREQLISKDKWFENKIDETVKNLDSEDFIVHKILPKGFSGLISEEGFEEFKQKDSILAIELTGGGSGQSIPNVFHLKWFVYLLVIVIIVLSILLIKFLNNKR